ncbi:hypothetical protein AD998_06460 [bacterium 336/3]|nr:hypothetical protein AD998_06460 [bacterium 336/3]
MNIRNYVYGCLLIALTACETSKPIANNPAQDKSSFFKQANIFFDDSKLHTELEKLKISENEVVEFCRKSEDAALKTKFAAAVYSNKNYNKTPAKKEFWAAIRYNLGRFVETVMLIREPNQKVFMDIGSGNGEKLFTSLCIGFDKAYGLEYSQESFEESKDNLKGFNKEIEIVKGDALEIDSTFYQKADFLYMYSPIKDDEIAAKLFKRVIDNMKDGAILLEVRCVYINQLRRLTKLNFPSLRSWIAIKKQNGKFFYKNVIDNSYNYNNTETKKWIEVESL